jgi:hypothetical protein
MHFMRTPAGDSNVSVGYLESALGLSKLMTALQMGDLAGKCFLIRNTRGIAIENGAKLILKNRLDCCCLHEGLREANFF